MPTERVLVVSKGAKLTLRLNSEGIGAVELDGKNISNALSGIVIEAVPGEIARAVLSFFVSEVDIELEEVAAAVVSPDMNPHLSEIATRIGNVIAQREAERIELFRKSLDQ